jgi:TatD DNase family protein
VLIDTHCHLDCTEFADDRDAVVERARADGVGELVVPAVSIDNFAAVRACCSRYVGCRPAYGIHPLYVDVRDPERELAALRAWLASEIDGPLPPLAVGEIGLDFFVAGHDVERQQRFYLGQLAIAREFDLPVLLHVRRAVDAVLKTLRRAGVRGGIAHAFNGSRQQADEFMRLGFKLGFGGTMTYPGSTRIRQLAASVPLEAIVLETDAPDIPPYWLDGARNEPAELAAIARTLAELRGVPVDEVAAATSANARAVLSRLPAAATAVREATRIRR